jgi:hypothetical protein
MSANARHGCFVMDASVSARTAETAELDDKQHPSKLADTLALPPKGDAATLAERTSQTTSGNIHL